MNIIKPVVVAAALAFVGTTAWTADPKDHKAHHPEAAKTSSKAPNAASSAVAANDATLKMDVQMKSMRAMHEKMVNAKTPEERTALMAEHMKSMQGGMAMMSGMAGAGSMAGAGKDRMKGGMSADMASHHQTMEKRMEMMEVMMQMMMDRLPAAPAK